MKMISRCIEMVKTDKRAYPLRKVLEEEGLMYAYLECGHKIITPQDIAGHYNADKRRCRKCAKGKGKDFDPENYKTKRGY